KKGSLIMVIALMGVLAACGSDNDSAGAEDDEIFIGQISWPENIAVTNMWQAVLEDEGYDVNLELVDMGPQMASLAEDDMDIAPEVWLPVQDKNYYEEYKDEVEGENTRFEPGAGTMETTEEMMEEYDLDYDLVDSSESAMISAVKDADEQEEPIVAPLWKPHFIFAEADMKFLDDPKKSFG